jgi:hypothetical protein
MNTNVNISDIENELNNKFIKQIKELPSDLKDPVENTLEYIKKRAKCNDYEAAQIQLLMSEQSAQKTGYKYYCRYIAGQSTPEEDQADYYKSIRKSWNKFLDKFANMTLEERAEAFTLSGSGEKAMEVLDVAGEGEFAYLDEKTKPILKKMESLGKEVESKSATYLMTHLSWTKKKAEELEDTSEQYFKKIIVASNEYKILESRSDLTQVKSDSWEDKTDETENIEGDAYKVATRAVDILNASEKTVTMQKVWQTATRERFEKDGLIQLRVSPSKANAHIYKFLLIKEVYSDKLECWVLEIVPRDKNGEEIKISEGDDEAEKIEYKKIEMLDYKDIDKVEIPLADLKKTVAESKFKWHIIRLIGRDRITKGPLFRVYDMDPTRFGERLKNITPPSQDSVYAGAISGLIISGLAFAAGIGIAIWGIVKYFKKPPQGDQKNLIGNPHKATGIGLIVSGITLAVTSAAGIISSSVILSQSVKENNEHKRQTKELLRDIWRHNYANYKKK